MQDTPPSFHKKHIWTALHKAGDLLSIGILAVSEQYGYPSNTLDQYIIRKNKNKLPWEWFENLIHGSSEVALVTRKGITTIIVLCMSSYLTLI